MYARQAANAYSKVNVETGVMGASPHKLISMLFLGARTSLANAKRFMSQGNIPEKGRAISHVISIIHDGLKASLNREAGGDLAYQLSDLYDYMCTTLMQANLRNDLSKLDEVDSLLHTIGSAWDEIAPGK
jgi:flagellar protein FliS